MGDIVVVIVTNTMFILPWVHEKFTVKFTMLNVDGYTIYNNIMHNRLAPLAVLSDPSACLLITGLTLTYEKKNYSNLAQVWII